MMESKDQNAIFPKGEKDILAVANVVVSFSNNKIGIEEARQIASVAVTHAQFGRCMSFASAPN